MSHPPTTSEARARDEPQADTASDVSEYSGGDDGKGDRPTPWLTTGQALELAAEMGLWVKSRPTFDRAAREGRLPQELVDAGLVADWEAKGQKGKNNATWLRFE